MDTVGITAAIVTEVAINSNDDIFASVWGISRSTDLGITWEPINNGLASYDVRALIVKNSNGYLFAGTNDNPNGIIFRSTDNGDSWVRVDNFPTALAINGLTSGPSGEIVATGSGMGSICHISTDDGVSWTDIRYNLTFGPGEVGINSNGDIIAASWGGGMWRKLSGDTLWTNIGASLYPYIGSLFIGSNDYIYAEKSKSTDNGETWSSMPIVGSNISSFAENSLGHLFCGTYNFGDGVSRSTDYGENWEQINTGLPIMDIRSVAVDADDYLYAGPWGYSLFKTTTPAITDVNEINFAPASFSLNQNYPNPFNPSTIIKYSIPSVISTERRNLNVTLRVYDVLGKEVAVLVNEEKPVGEYEVEFDGTRLSSGVYFYQIKSNNFLQTKKMILLK